MLNQRQRVLVWAGCALVVIWALAFAGYKICQNFKMTAAKVRAYVESVDLSKLSEAERAAALQRLAEMMNNLSVDERRLMQRGRLAEKWFAEMTEEEKGAFIDATMPTGFKQMLASFEKLPEEKRRKLVDDALKRMRENRDGAQSGNAPQSGGTNRPPPLSPELEAKVRTLGLKSFYSDSSAQTKAELAPVLEEMQRAMQSGRYYRGR